MVSKLPFASVSNQFLAQSLSYENSFYSRVNEPKFACFETEVKGNLEITYLLLDRGQEIYII